MDTLHLSIRTFFACLWPLHWSLAVYIVLMDPVHRELAPSSADQVLSTGASHPAHVAVIDNNQALAPC